MSLFVVNQQIKEHVERLHLLQEVICKGYHFTDVYSFDVVFPMSETQLTYIRLMLLSLFEFTTVTLLFMSLIGNKNINVDSELL